MKRRWMRHENSCDRRCREVARKLWSRTEGRVFAGPFAGMRVPFESTYAIQPNLLVGSYEREIEEAILEMIVLQPGLVVNIGAAEGYYSVGMALAVPGAHVIAYDLYTGSQQLLKRCAELNGVEKRIEIKGRCEPQDLSIMHEGPSAVISDCEGAEYELLRTEAAPLLRGAFVICELHDFIDPRITPALIERFRATHDIELRTETNKNPNLYRILDDMKPWERRLAVHENRHIKGVPFSSRYMIMRPKLVG